jgi:uncharacterized protein YndB with AHSA1/START domain
MTIRKSILIKRPPEVCFRVFCEEMSEWWPGGFGGKDSKPRIEPRVGGRFYERRPDGSEYQIGEVTVYSPPEHLGFTFRAPSWDVSTQVEIRFRAESAGTRVELEHSGWDQDAKTRDARKGFDGGWDFVLGRYQSRFADIH